MYTGTCVPISAETLLEGLHCDSEHRNELSAGLQIGKLHCESFNSFHGIVIE